MNPRPPVIKITFSAPFARCGTLYAGPASLLVSGQPAHGGYNAMRRYMTILSATAALGIALLATAIPAAACAGLIGSNGAVNLGRTTTLAAYHDGVEHYVTAFQFLGGGGQFGTLIPLPDFPSNVEKGGSWTLQRLVRETAPPRALRVEALAAAPAADGVQVLMQTRVDALDLTVLKGGSRDV